MQYRAIVSIEFTSEDLQEYVDLLGVDEMDPMEAVTAELDNMSLGTGWLEQAFRDGIPMISRMTAGGLEITINDHDLDLDVEVELEDDRDVDDEY